MMRIKAYTSAVGVARDGVKLFLRNIDLVLHDDVYQVHDEVYR
jgi:hypothetical protein